MCEMGSELHRGTLISTYVLKVSIHKQVHTTNAPTSLLRQGLLSTCVCPLTNVHLHPQQISLWAWGAKEHEAPPQTSTCSQLPRTARGWASKLRLDQSPASCSAGALAGASPEGSVDPTLTANQTLILAL